MRILLASVISLLACAPVQRPPPEEPDPPVGAPQEPRGIDLTAPPPTQPPAAKPAAAAPPRTASAKPRVRIVEKVLPD